MPKEIEAKFDVDRDFDPPDLRGFVDRTRRLPEQHLRTVYFDTPDRRLAARGISLRHRTATTSDGSRGEASWTLKLPEASDGPFLDRSEMSWAGDRETIPAPVATVLRGLVRRCELQPIAELDTTRRRLILVQSKDGERWGELDDDLVSVVGGPRDGASFRQIELELLSSESSVARSVLDRLSQAGAKPTKRSKASMVLGETPKPSYEVRRSKRRKLQRLSHTIRGAIGSNLDRLLDHDYRLRIDPYRPDARDVHQARVAIRRLRCDLKLFARVVDPIWLTHTRDDLRWISSILGRVRDLDVLSDNLLADGDRAQTESSARQRGAVSELLAGIETERSQSAQDLSDALGSSRYLDLLDRLHAAVEATPLVPAPATQGATRHLRPDGKSSDALAVLVAERFRKLKRRVRKASKHPTNEELHRIRIGAKRLRYAAETAAAAIGKRALKTARAAEELQTVLGELRDLDAAENWLRDQARDTRLSPETIFAAGELAGQHRNRQRVLRDQWRSTWKHVERERIRS